MNKLMIAITLVATAAAALPANAAPRNTTNPSAQSSIKVGDQCFRQTDGRGYGYWTSCENVYVFQIGRPMQTLSNEVRSQIDRGADGGGGDGGGGGGQR